MQKSKYIYSKSHCYYPVIVSSDVSTFVSYAIRCGFEPIFRIRFFFNFEIEDSIISTQTFLIQSLAIFHADFFPGIHNRIPHT